MTFASSKETMGLHYPMPSAALAPLAWYLGVHMLKCLQEAGKTTTTTTRCVNVTVKIPTEDKTTQIDIFSKKTKDKDNTQDKKTPTKVGRHHEKIDSSKRHHPRKSESDIRPDSRIFKSDATNRDLKSDVQNVTNKEGLSNSRSRESKTASRRNSTGSCPKRTSEAQSGSIVTEWLMNPVYTGETGDRTDRSEMSLTWRDLSNAKEEKAFEESMPRLAVKSFAETVQKHVPVKIRPTQPTMEPVQEAPRDSKLRSQQGTRNPTPTDLFVQEVVKRKIGRSLADIDTASLKSISRERVKQLAERYAHGDRPRANAADHVPASVLAQQALRARDSADRIYVRADPRRGR